MWLRRIYLYFYKKECDMHKNLLEQRIAKCLFLLIFCVHFCAGVLYLSACLEVRCHEESWAWNAGLKSAQSNFYHYVQAAYWATSTMTSVGYGDIIPNSLTERLLAVVVGIAGLLIFSYFIGQIFATISGENANRWTYQNLLSEMRHFMDQHDLTVFQQNRVIKYMNLLWFKYQGDAYPGGPFLMRDLPPELKQTVLMTERGKLLLNIPYFEEAGQSFIQDLALVSVMYFFPKGEIIQYRNTITRELFCIRRGTCQILNDNLSEIVGCYQKEMYFGEAGFLFGKQAILTVRAATCCEILVIDFDKVSVVLEKHPVIKRQIEELQANSEFYKTMVETSEKLMRTYCKLPEETGGVQRKEKVPLTFQGRRYFEKSKCYIEYFGNIHIYAGSEEETVAEHLQKLQSEQLGLQRPRSLKEHIPQFLLKSCLSFFLMKSAILPSNALFVGWEFFRTVLAVAVSVISSLLFAFLHYKIEMWIACYILGSLCWIDIYIRMHVAFYKDNDLKVDTLETAYHYLNTSFLMDFITCFPWELIGWAVVSPFSENGFYANNEALHFYAYLRIPHIFQLYRVHLVFSYLQSDISAEINIITFLKLLLYSILFIHFSTCIVFATVCPLVDLYGDVNMYLLPMIKHNCTPSSWVTHLDSSFNVDFATVTFAQLYSTSFYFAATTVCGVGFGDIHPHLTLMKVSMIIIMVAGTLFCGWFSGTVTAMLANADATRIAYTERIESMKLFLKSHKITGALYDSVIGYYTFRWMLTEGIDQEKLFKYLPSSIVGDISTVIYADFITKVFGLYLKNQIELETHQLSPLEIRKAGKLNGPFFELMLTKENMEQLETDGCFIRMLTRKIRPCFFRASDLIYKKSDYGSEMYFIKKGEVDVLANDHLTVLFKLKAGQYFGERSLLLGEPRAATIRAASTCHLYVLSKKSLDETFKYYPSIQEQIERAADMMKDQLYQGDHQLKTQRKPDSADESSFRDSGYLKLYRDCMAEEEHRAKLRALPLHIKLRTRVKEIFTKVFNTISRIHNKTIDPENTFRVIYQYVSCLLTTVSFCSITYMLTVYDVDWNVFMLTMIVECIQIIEIFLKFHISFYDDSGKYISDRKSISQNYMKRKVGYVFDLVCSFPYDFIVLHQMSEKEPEEFLSIIVYTRTVQLLRIISLLVFMWREEQSITTNLLYIRIITCLVYIIVFVHCVALLLIYFVRVNGLGSWVSETEIVDFPEMYRYAVYWVLQMYTTTGYGDITPATLGEMTACVVVMVLSKIQASYKMGLLISPETNKRKLHEDYEENLQTIRTYMMDEKIPSELQKRVLQFYRYRWTRTNGTELEVLFKDIPHCLKMEIMSRICIQFLRKHQLFNHLPEPFLRELSTRMHIRCFPVGEYIYRKGDTSTGMYLILIGKVKLCPDTRGTKIIQHLSVGAAFGEHFLLKCTLFRDTAIAANCVDIAILSKDSFDEVGVLYPDVMNKLLNRAADVLKL